MIEVLSEFPLIAQGEGRRAVEHIPFHRVALTQRALAFRGL